MSEECIGPVSALGSATHHCSNSSSSGCYHPAHPFQNLALQVPSLPVPVKTIHIDHIFLSSIWVINSQTASSKLISPATFLQLEKLCKALHPCSSPPSACWNGSSCFYHHLLKLSTSSALCTYCWEAHGISLIRTPQPTLRSLNIANCTLMLSVLNLLWYSCRCSISMKSDQAKCSTK